MNRIEYQNKVDAKYLITNELHKDWEHIRDDMRVLILQLPNNETTSDCLFGTLRNL